MRPCAKCGADLVEMTIDEAAHHLAFHEEVATWEKSIPSQDKKPDLPKIAESRNEAYRNHIGWFRR